MQIHLIADANSATQMGALVSFDKPFMSPQRLIDQGSINL
jgi:hypothetical protein